MAEGGFLYSSDSYADDLPYWVEGPNGPHLIGGIEKSVTVYGVATALHRNPEAVLARREANWEIASHGIKWIDYKDVTEDEERRQFPTGRLRRRGRRAGCSSLRPLRNL